MTQPTEVKQDEPQGPGLCPPHCIGVLSPGGVMRSHIYPHPDPPTQSLGAAPGSSLL